MEDEAPRGADRRDAGQAAADRLGWPAAAALLALMLLIAADVAARYGVGRPIVGAYQLVMALLAAMVFLGLPGVTARAEHLQAGLLDHWLAGRWRRLRHWLIAATTVVALAGLAWRLGAQALRYQATGATLASVGLPLASLAWIGAASCAVSAAIALAAAVRHRPRAGPGA